MTVTTKTTMVAALALVLTVLSSSFLAAPSLVVRAAIIPPFVPPEPESVDSLLAGGSLSLSSLKIGQTYMFEAPKKVWYKKSDDLYIDAHLSGNRSTLFVIEFGGSVPTNPELIFTNDALAGNQMKLTLNDPSLLPKTHGHDDPMARPYSTTAYSVVLDAAYIVKGLKVFVKTDNLGNSAEMSIPVGPVISMKTWSVPLYMFGASEDMLDKDGVPVTKERRGWMGDEKAQEHWAKYPFARFYNGLHPIQKFESPYWIIRPRTSKTGRKKTAFRAYYKNDIARPINSDYSVDSSDDTSDSYKDGFGDEASGLAFLSLLHELDGEFHLSTHYYAALIFRSEDGEWESGGAGLGGGHHGAGTSDFEGIFYHEQGHAFGLGHAESDYEKGDYPYKQGSLDGSDWGYDVVRNEFIDVYIHTDAEGFDGDADECTKSGPRTVYDDGKKKCIKQSVMQSGSGDQESDMNFGQMADYNVAEILEHIEGLMESEDPDNDPDGPKVVKEGGRTFHDTCTCGNRAYYNYRVWNNTAQELVPVTPNWEYPHYFNVPLVLIWTTIGCAELDCQYSYRPLETSPKQVLTQVYKPHTYVGNTRLVVNPDNFDVLKTVLPEHDGAVNGDFCKKGCDFTAYVTLADGTLRKALIRNSPRDDWEDVEFPSDVRDKYHGDSLENYGVAVPTGGQAVERVDIMYTPLAWQGFHNRIPQVIASWSSANGEEKPAAPQDLSSNKMTYDFKLNLEEDISICEISELIKLELIVAIERAVMETLTCDEKLALPTFSSAIVKCVCFGDACERDCEWTRPLPTYDSDSSASSSSVYDATTDTCGGSSVHIDTLTADVSGGVTRYYDADGNMYKLVNPGLSPISTNGYDGSTGSSRDACRDIGPTAGSSAAESWEIDTNAGLSPMETCYGFIYRSGGYKTFLTTQCMEPCMIKTVPDKYEAFLSLEESGSWPFRTTPDVSFNSINFKIELDIMNDLVAGQVYHKLAQPALLNKISSKILGDAFVQEQWSGISASSFSTPVVQSLISFPVPFMYPSVSTVCYGRSSWQEPPSPLETPSCVTECGEEPSDSPGAPVSDDPPSSTPDSSDPPSSSGPPSSSAPSSVLESTPASKSPGAVLQVTMYLKGYNVQLFNSAARLNFRSAVAAAINSPEVNADDVYIISINDIYAIPPTSRKLLQNVDETAVEVYFEILVSSRDVATQFSDVLKLPRMSNILLASGLTNIEGVQVQTTVIEGNTYTTKSQVEQDMEEFGFTLVGVLAGALAVLSFVLALFMCGIARPSSCMGTFLRRRLGEEKFNAKVESHFNSKSMKLQLKTTKLQEKSTKLHKQLDKCQSKAVLARAASQAASRQSEEK